MDTKQKARIFRERFYGRQDVFGQQWENVDRNTGEKVKGYTPLCYDHYAPNCHIKLNDNIACSDCEIQNFVPVTDKSVLEHIQGGLPQMHYLLQPDSNIMFGAFDFDQKPGKEAKGHDWKDVLKVQKVMKRWGMPYAIARSTGNGYHIYYFMDEPYPARKFKEILMQICKEPETGFHDENINGVRLLPERFPKQGWVSGTGFGNGIKPPMIEPNFEKGRNCFVDDNNKVIEDQWAYLDSVPRIRTHFLDGLIDLYNIKVEAEPVAGKSKSHHSKSSFPIGGSIEKVVEGCKTFRALNEKMKGGYSPSHHEGMGLFHMAMNTLDGKDWFIHNVPGWGKDSRQLRQLQQSENKGYAPWTCRTMQEHGVCPPNTKCFDKKPPIEYVEGKAVVKSDVPESQWPDPSPVRYALGKGEDFLKKLLSEIDDVSKIEDIEIKNGELANIISRVSVFDKPQQGILKDYIEKLKIAKKTELNKVFNKANSDRSEKIREIESEGSEYFVFNGTQFKYLDPGYAMLRPGKKNQEASVLVLSDCYIDIIEERTVVEELMVKKKVLFGRFTSNSVTCDFEIDSAEWADNSSFIQFFVKLAGIAFNIKRPDVDNVRQAIHYTSAIGRPGMQPCKRTTYFSAPGWYDETYITQSVVIDRTGVRPNTEKPVFVSGPNQNAANIDFKLMSDPELLATVFHIKADFLKAFQRDHVMLGLGFTMIAGIHKYLGLRYRPTFWLEGTTGNGKTEYLLALQAFYGNFLGGVKWGTTGKSVLEYAYQFKDSLMLMDDFKARTREESQAAGMVIQDSYEHSIRGALNKDGTQRGDKYSRCMFLMSGEEIPNPNGASEIARTFILGAPKKDQLSTKVAYNQVVEQKEHYKGVTPKFIHWVLNQDKKKIQRELLEYQDAFQLPIRSMQNASRVAYNTAVVYLGWALFCDFMKDVGAATDAEIADFKQECWNFCEVVRDASADRCRDQQGVNVFMSRLTEMLSSGEIGIKNLDGYDREGMKLCGFVDNKDSNVGICYIWPDTAIELVRKSMSIPLIISKVSAGTQLDEAGALAKRDAKGGPQIVKNHNGASVRVWCVKLDKLGIGHNPRVVGGTQSMMNLVQPIPNMEGLI